MIEIKKLDRNTTILSKLRLSNIRKSGIKFPFQIALVLLLIISGIISWNIARGAINVIDKKEEVAKEESRPANLEIITITDKTCTNCSTLTNLIDYIKSQNVKIVKETFLDVGDSDAQTMIKEYGINKIPFMLVEGELDKDSELKKAWPTWGSIQNNVFVLTYIMPPYIDLLTKEINGLVDITYITDESCEECLDVKLNKNILESNYGVTIIKENIFDISSKEGKEFQEKYQITKVPTFLLNNEVAVYQGLLAVWKNIGTIEIDGTYVFRKVELLGVYYDLEKREVVDTASEANTDQNIQ